MYFRTSYTYLFALRIFGFLSFRQNYLYWTDATKKSIMRSNLDGNNIADILGQTLQEPGVPL